MGRCNTCLVLLVGIPAAGKTSFCNNLKLDPSKFSMHLITYDKLLTDFTSASRKNIFNKVENLVLECILSKDNIDNVILIDDNLYYKSMRQLDLQTAIYRNSLRENSVPESVIVDMYSKLEIPTLNVLFVNSTQFDDKYIEQFNHFLNEALQNPLQKCINHPITQSKLHKIDLILRKMVGEFVKRNKSAKSCNIIRKVVYKHVKNGNIMLDNITDEDLDKFLCSCFEFLNFSKD